MSKKKSIKFWLIFWIVAIALLAGWFVFLQVKFRNIKNIAKIARILPIGKERRNEISVLLDIYSKVGGFDSEKNILVLFQNNLELRPSGGFIGAFAVVKIDRGKISDIQVFDTGNFDKNIPTGEKPPIPLADVLGKENWTMRDSNWSPDFKIDAEKAEYFYHLGGGKEKIDGVVAINTSVLNSILSVTGPVKMADYPGEYRDENAILQLEYQVERGYLEQGISKAERKNIMSELADVLAKKIQELNFSQQWALVRKAENHFRQKDIQLYFANADLQKKIENIDWAGRVKDAESDYLMIVDANMNALKSDYCIKRKADYRVDLTKEIPEAELEIAYEHTCRAKDWMTTDYHDWLRVYVPAGASLLDSSGQENKVQVSDDLEKKVFEMEVFVPLGKTKTIKLKYQLPQTVRDEYSLLVQKQSGSGELPIEIFVKREDGREVKKSDVLTGDKQFEF